MVGRGVKTIIWEEKKNDLSSGCQQRKHLCFVEGERGLVRGSEWAPLHLGKRGHCSVHALATAVAVAAWEWTVTMDVSKSYPQRRQLGDKTEPEELTLTQSFLCVQCCVVHSASTFSGHPCACEEALVISPCHRGGGESHSGWGPCPKSHS